MILQPPASPGANPARLSYFSSPVKRFSGIGKVPGDKSISHRAVILATLASGTTTISNLLDSEDVRVTMEVAQRLGAEFEPGNQPRHYRVHGRGGQGLIEPTIPLDMGNSGTSARLWMGALAGFPMTTFFTGDASLSRRPMDRVIKPLEEMGAQFIARKGRFLPLAMKGKEQLESINYTLPEPSAQVKSAILLAALAAAGQGSTIVIDLHRTRRHTEVMLKRFGADIQERVHGHGYYIHLRGPATLQATSISIPGDPSSAAFAVVANLLVGDASLRIPRIEASYERIGLYEILQEMGADIYFHNWSDEASGPVTDIESKPSSLSGVVVPAERAPTMIDEYPILAVAAACAQGSTIMHGLTELRFKESDRLTMLVRGLESCGVSLELDKDSLTIHGRGTGDALAGGATVEVASDHRLAMSFLVLGMAAKAPVAIDDGSFIGTSFPGFVDFMNALGADIRPSD